MNETDSTTKRDDCGVRFMYLSAALGDLSETDVARRVDEFTDAHLGTYVVGVGGFPITEDARGTPTWLGAPVNVTRVREALLDGFGLAAALTYMNRSDKTFRELGQLSVDRDHLWAAQWLVVDLLFVGYGAKAEMALLRDCQVKTSWPVDGERGRVFMGHGTLAAWRYFTSHRDDRSFDEGARELMRDAWLTVNRLQYDPNG